MAITAILKSSDRLNIVPPLPMDSVHGCIETLNESCKLARPRGKEQIGRSADPHSVTILATPSKSIGRRGAEGFGLPWKYDEICSPGDQGDDIAFALCGNLSTLLVDSAPCVQQPSRTFPENPFRRDVWVFGSTPGNSSIGR